MRPSSQYHALLRDYTHSTKEHGGGLCRFLSGRVGNSFDVDVAWKTIQRLAREGLAVSGAEYVRDWSIWAWLYQPGRTPERVALAASAALMLEDPEAAAFFDAAYDKLKLKIS